MSCLSCSFCCDSRGALVSHGLQFCTHCVHLFSGVGRLGKDLPIMEEKVKKKQSVGAPRLQPCRAYCAIVFAVV